MRPEDLVVSPTPGQRSVQVPLDVELASLDAELQAAGARARLMLNGQRQPTRYFSLQLRQSLLDGLTGEADSLSRR
jgi:hypothetical protein